MSGNESETEQSPAEGGSRKRSKKVLWIAAGLVVATICACNPFTFPIAMRLGLATPFALEGPSMRPTYEHGDHLIIAGGAFGLTLPFTGSALFSWAWPERGEVVLVRWPEGFDMIKRVVGLPGDRVEIVDDALFVNGVRVSGRVLGETMDDDEPVMCVAETLDGRHWTVLEHIDARPDNMPEVTVPEGHVFVLGDNRDRTSDSRNPSVGPISRGLIRGRVESLHVRASPRLTCPSR